MSRTISGGLPAESHRVPPLQTIAWQRAIVQIAIAVQDRDKLTYVTIPEHQEPPLAFPALPAGTFKPPMFGGFPAKIHHKSDDTYMLPKAQSDAILQDICGLPEAVLQQPRLRVCSMQTTQRTRSRQSRTPKPDTTETSFQTSTPCETSSRADTCNTTRKHNYRDTSHPGAGDHRYGTTDSTLRYVIYTDDYYVCSHQTQRRHDQHSEQGGGFRQWLITWMTAPWGLLPFGLTAATATVRRIGRAATQ